MKTGRSRPVRRQDSPGEGWTPGLAVPVLLLLLALAGCQRVGMPRPEPPAPGEPEEEPAPLSPPPEAPVGFFRGDLVVEGARTSATLEIQEARDEIRALLAASPDIRAEGEGRFEDQQLRLELTYQDPCPGIIVLEGRWDPDTGVYAGTLRARDCTGEAEGTFQLHWAGDSRASR